MIDGSEWQRRGFVGLLGRGACIALVVAATAMLCVASLAEAQEPELSVEACGLRVVGTGHGEGIDAIRPLNWSPGTTLALMVTLPEGGLIGFDSEASRLEGLTDDRGTDLLAGGTTGQTGFGAMPSFSADRACIIEISGRSVPVREARQVRASGVMVFATASQQEAFRHEDLALQEGAQLQAGPVAFRVTEVGPPDWGDAAMQVTLEAKEDCTAVVDIRFADAAGRPIEAQPAGTTRMSMFGNVTVQEAFTFERKLERATVTVTYWTDLAKREVPFSVNASVGL